MPQHSDYTRFHRLELSEGERAIVDRYHYATDIPDGTAAPDGTRREGNRLIHPDGRIQPIGMVGAHVEIAYGRAQRQLEKLGTQPEALEDIRGFEGIDPQGHYGPHDLAYTQRIQKIRQAAAVASPEVRDALTTALSMLDDESILAGQFKSGFKKDCDTLRTMHRAAKVCHSMEGYDLLMEQAEELEDANIEAMDKMLNGLEYVAGIRTEAPTVQEQGYVAQCFGWNGRTMDQFHKLSAQKDPVVRNLTIPYANFDHRLKQQFLAHPSNWDKGSKDVPNDYRTEAVADQAMEQYATESVKGTLDALYRGTESRHPFTRRLNGINRTKLITVDGKTVDQLMREDYAKKLLPPGDYERWQMENMEAMTARIVSAGLMAGKRVEAFLTNAEGDVLDEPVTISKEGYEPSPLKPVTMNSVQRFMSKHGFYKERVAKEEEYARVMAAREQVKAQNAASRVSETGMASDAQKVPYLAEHERIHGPVAGRSQHSTLHSGRDALSACCACYLAGQGHSLDDILDPTKLTKEKGELGRHFMELSEATAAIPEPEIKRRDESPEAYQARCDEFYAQNPGIAMRKQTRDAFEAEMGRWIYAGEKALLEGVEQRLEGRDMRTFTTDPDCAKVCAMVHLGFDASQIKAFGKVADGYRQAAGEDYASNPEMQAKLADHPSFQGYVPGTPLNREQQTACAALVDTPINNLAFVIEPVGYVLKGRVEMTEFDKRMVLRSEIVADVVLSEMDRRKKASPGTKTSELVPYEQACVVLTAASTAVHMAFETDLDENPLQKDRIQQEMRSGKMRETFGQITVPTTMDGMMELTSRINDAATEVNRRTMAPQPQIQQNQPAAQPPQQTQQPQQPRAPRQGGMGRH